MLIQIKFVKLFMYCIHNIIKSLCNCYFVYYFLVFYSLYTFFYFFDIYLFYLYHINIYLFGTSALNPGAGFLHIVPVAFDRLGRLVKR